MNLLNTSVRLACLSMAIWTAKALTLATTCKYNGNIYQANTTFKIGNCKSGYCKDNGCVEISPTCCEYEGHTYEFDTHFEGQNCTTGYCLDDGTVEFFQRCCLYKGTEYELETFSEVDECSSLHCQGDGQTVLRTSSCPKADCPYMHKVEGVCCPVCDDE